MHRLPLDLHILIQSFLDPCDIISLRMTSKLLHAATQRRAVWLSALHRVCVDHALFEPSFPAQNMAIAELEYAALSPARVSARMKNGPNGSKIEPLKNRSFQDSLSKNYNQISLTSGGRYLLTGSNKPYCGVSLWDLGMSAACVIPSSPITTTPEEVGLIDTSPTSDGFGILVTAYFTDVGPVTHIVMYEIYPSAKEPRFCRKGNLKLGGRIIVHSLSGYHFVSLDRTKLLTFWDIKSNKSFTWDAAFDLGIGELYMLKNHLIILNQTKITVWEIPFLKRAARGDIPDDEFAKHFPPTLKLSHSFATDPILLSVPSQWWPTPHDDIILGSAAPEDGVSEVTLYRLDPGMLASGVNEIGVLSSIPLRMVKQSDFLLGLRYCNKELCQRWRPNEDVLINLMPIPTSPEERKSAVTRILYSGPLSNFDFCPASGRFVVATREGVVRVLDFIAPMSELDEFSARF